VLGFEACEGGEAGGKEKVVCPGGATNTGWSKRPISHKNRRKRGEAVKKKDHINQNEKRDRNCRDPAQTDLQKSEGETEVLSTPRGEKMGRGTKKKTQKEKNNTDRKTSKQGQERNHASPKRTDPEKTWEKGKRYISEKCKYTRGAKLNNSKHETQGRGGERSTPTNRVRE